MSRQKNGFEVDGGWVAAAIATVVCPPIGLFMLYRKLKKTHNTSRDASQLNRVGISLLAAGGILHVLNMGGVFFWLLMGGALILGGQWIKKRDKRYYRYLAVLAGRNAMFLVNLAATMDLSVEQVTADIQHMLDKGWFRQGAYLDKQSGRIVLCKEGVTDFSGFAEAQRREKQAAKQQESVQQQAPAAVQKQPAPQPKPEVQPQKEKPLFENSEYDKIIREIRVLNDRIDDKVISDRIDRIELLTTRIFHLVEERPAMKPQIRKFMNYYLPTTLKLLDSYALLEEQGIEGENITASKKEIERTMDTLVAGFEKQLDRLFSSQAMDITSDVEVLEGMMAQDGLKENKYEMKMGRGN